jgi:sugar/nucleoside kinase (ribokinase family)
MRVNAIVDVLGMGAVAMDLVLGCEDLPGEDGFAFVREERWTPGGSCSNVLVTLTSMGARCAVAAQIGDDRYGEGVKADLESAGISTGYLITRRGGVSLHTLVAVDKRGARSIFANLGDAFLSLSESHVTREMFEGTKAFYTDMFTAKPALKAALLCREMGIPTVFNLECSPAFMESCKVGREDLEEMISLCHLFCVGREGLRGLTAMADERQAAIFLNDRYAPSGGVVVTLGDAGAFWAGNGKTISVPAFPVEAVDTTGTGDAFAGGLIYARFLQKWDMETSLVFASACGAIKCQQPGPRIKASEKEVEALIETYRSKHAR